MAQKRSSGLTENIRLTGAKLHSKNKPANIFVAQKGSSELRSGLVKNIGLTQSKCVWFQVQVQSLHTFHFLNKIPDSLRLKRVYLKPSLKYLHSKIVWFKKAQIFFRTKISLQNLTHFIKVLVPDPIRA